MSKPHPAITGVIVSTERLNHWTPMVDGNFLEGEDIGPGDASRRGKNCRAQEQEINLEFKARHSNELTQGYKASASGLTRVFGGRSFSL